MLFNLAENTDPQEFGTWLAAQIKIATEDHALGMRWRGTHVLVVFAPPSTGPQSIAVASAEQADAVAGEAHRIVTVTVPPIPRRGQAYRDFILALYSSLFGSPESKRFTADLMVRRKIIEAVDPNTIVVLDSAERLDYSGHFFLFRELEQGLIVLVQRDNQWAAKLDKASHRFFPWATSAQAGVGVGAER